jgi:hypothetical protein
MNIPKSQKQLLKFFLFCIFSLSVNVSFSRQDSTKVINYFGGAVNLTNNGISLLPSFSLGKPAIMFDMVVGRKKLSFEPQFRFALEGKPWSFLFWWRYKLLKTPKWAINIGAHPAIAFKERTYMVNGEAKDVIVSQRFLAGEFAPSLAISPTISLGIYYLYAHGFENDASKSTNFFALRSNFSAIKLSRQWYMRCMPQFYYLSIDDKNGFYVNSTFTLAKNNFPIAITSIISKTIKTDIVGKDFVWNIGLNYAFGKNYVGKTP